MKDMWNWPNNPTKGYMTVDANWSDNETFGMDKRIKDLVDGTYKAWEGLNPKTDLTKAGTGARVITPDMMNEVIASYKEYIDNYISDENMTFYKAWSVPLVEVSFALDREITRFYADNSTGTYVANMKMLQSLQVSGSTAGIPDGTKVYFNSGGSNWISGFEGTAPTLIGMMDDQDFAYVKQAGGASNNHYELYSDSGLSTPLKNTTHLETEVLKDTGAGITGGFIIFNDYHPDSSNTNKWDPTLRVTGVNGGTNSTQKLFKSESVVFEDVMTATAGHGGTLDGTITTISTHPTQTTPMTVFESRFSSTHRFKLNKGIQASEGGSLYDFYAKDSASGSGNYMLNMQLKYTNGSGAGQEIYPVGNYNLTDMSVGNGITAVDEPNTRSTNIAFSSGVRSSITTTSATILAQHKIDNPHSATHPKFSIGRVYFCKTDASNPGAVSVATHYAVPNFATNTVQGTFAEQVAAIGTTPNEASTIYYNYGTGGAADTITLKGPTGSPEVADFVFGVTGGDVSLMINLLEPVGNDDGLFRVLRESASGNYYGSTNNGPGFQVYYNNEYTGSKEGGSDPHPTAGHHYWKMQATTVSGGNQKFTFQNSSNVTTPGARVIDGSEFWVRNTGSSQTWDTWPGNIVNAPSHSAVVTNAAGYLHQASGLVFTTSGGPTQSGGRWTQTAANMATYTSTGSASGLTNAMPAGDEFSNAQYTGGYDTRAVLQFQAVPDEYVTPTAYAEDVWDTDDEWDSNAFNASKLWPTHVTPSGARLTVAQPSSTTRSQNGTKYVRSSGVIKHQLELTYPPMTQDDFREFEAVVEAARGQATPFYVNFVGYGASNDKVILGHRTDANKDNGGLSGNIGSYVRVKDAIAVGDKTILVEGFTSDATDVFIRGEYIIANLGHANGNLVQVINDNVDSNVYGEAKFRIPYGARIVRSTGSELYKKPSHVIVTLAEDEFEYNVGTDGLYRFTCRFDFDEFK